MKLVFFAILCAALFSQPALAQVSSRAEELEIRRRNEGGRRGDDDRSQIERGFVWLGEKRVLERLTRGIGGWRVVIGNLISGSGFGIGPEYYRDEIKDGAVQFRIGARASARKYMLGEAELRFPKLLKRRAYLDLTSRWRNYPGVNYYGPGPESRKSGRSAYRLEDAAHDVSFGYQPFRGARLGVTGGYLQVNVGPGKDKRFVSSDQIYSPQQAPGIDRQTDYLRGGVLAEYDYRDTPGGAKIGGFYQARYDSYQDRSLKLHTHRQFRMEAQQYIPFFNRSA